MKKLQYNAALQDLTSFVHLLLDMLLSIKTFAAGCYDMSLRSTRMDRSRHGAEWVIAPTAMRLMPVWA